MTKTVLKEKIHQCIEHIDDNSLLEAVYTILNKHSTQYDFKLSSEDLKIINKRRKAILSGKEKTYTVKEVKKKLLKSIGK